MKEGRKPEHPEKTPGDELQKMPHTTARRFKPQARLEPVHWWQARKADLLTVTPRVVFSFSSSSFFVFFFSTSFPLPFCPLLLRLLLSSSSCFHSPSLLLLLLLLVLLLFPFFFFFSLSSCSSSYLTLHPTASLA